METVVLPWIEKTYSDKDVVYCFQQVFVKHFNRNSYTVGRPLSRDILYSIFAMFHPGHFADTGNWNFR